MYDDDGAVLVHTTHISLSFSNRLSLVVIMERIWSIHPREHLLSTHRHTTNHHTSILYQWNINYSLNQLLYLACTTITNNICIWSIDHILVHTIAHIQPANDNHTPIQNDTNQSMSCILPYTCHIIQLQWCCNGTVLAILTDITNNTILLFDLNTLTTVNISDTCELYSDICIIHWCRTTLQLLYGTLKGELCLLNCIDIHNVQQQWCVQRHKKRIVCIDCNNTNKCASASDDRYISITYLNDGKLYGQVKVKSRPNSIKFGSRDIDPSRNNTSKNNIVSYNYTHDPNDMNDNLVSVSMDYKTILLYNLIDGENALELAFQSRYGSIVSFAWFNSSYIMVGFTLGYLVVISTNIEQIGREQFAARFHRDSLIDLSYNSISHQLICCNDTTIKYIDMYTWKELYTIEIERSVGCIVSCSTTQGGNIITVLTNKNYILVYAIDSTLIPNTNNIATNNTMNNTDSNYSLFYILTQSMTFHSLIVYCMCSIHILLCILHWYYDIYIIDCYTYLFRLCVGTCDIYDVINEINNHNPLS